MDSKIEPVAWRYAINYGPDGEQNYANVYDGNGDMVGNLKTPHAIAIVRAMNTAPPEAALLAAEQRGRESERGEIVKALSKFVPDYEPWMGKHADGTPLTIHRTGNTFGDLRAAHAAIRKGE